MFALSFICHDAVQTFCIEEDAPRQRLIADLPDGGELIIENGWIIPKSLNVKSTDGRTMNAPLCASQDFTCILKGKHDNALLMVRQVEAENLIAECYDLPSAASVGRNDTNTIVYQDHFISSFHGHFFLNASADLCYRDESTNGTAYNGKIVRNACLTLKSGDQLLLPPLLHITIDNSKLLINRPRELLSCILEPFKMPQDNMRQALLFFVSVGMLYRVDMPRSIDSLTLFRSYAAARLPANTAPLLLLQKVLLEGHTQRPLITDSDLLDCFQRGNCTFIIP